MITIRFYEPEDARSLFEAASESVQDVYPWLPWCHPGYTIEEAKSWIASQTESRAKDLSYEFAVVGHGGEYLGGVGLNQISWIHRNANLGYWVRSSAAGRGYTPEAVRALTRWAFTHTELERLEILAATSNQRSQRVAEKVGARHEGILRSRLFAHDRYEDAVVYSIIRTDQGSAGLAP